MNTENDDTVLDGPAQTAGDRVLLLCKARGMTQTELARRVGVTSAAISDFIIGKSKDLRMKNLLEVSRALSTSIAYIVEGSPSDPDGYDDEDDDSPKAALMLVELHPKDAALLSAYRQLQPDARLAIRNLIQTLSAAQNPALAQHEAQAHSAALARTQGNGT